MQAYYKLLAEHKNEKLMSVITQTDAYLRKLGNLVRTPLCIRLPPVLTGRVSSLAPY